MLGLASNSLARIDRGPLRDLIYEQLLELISSGQLAPGTRLVEKELATELGTSRVPVREALVVLHKEGWVDLHPRRGAQVHIPAEGEVDEVFAVRAALESEAGRLASARASASDVEALRAQIATGMELAQAGEHAAAAQQNSAFHRAVTQISGNELLRSLLGGVERRVWWYFSQVATVRGVSSWVEHAAIVEAIAAGDEVRSAATMRAHVEATRDAFHATNHERRG